jgi:hypothetical protein
VPGYHWFAAEGSSLNIQNSEITQVHGFTVDQDEFTVKNHEGSVQFYGVRSWFRNSPANSYHDGRSLFHFDSGDPQDDNFDGLSRHIETERFTFEEGATYGLQNIETGSWSGKKEIQITFSDDKGNFGLPPSASHRSNSQITIMHSTLPYSFWEEESDWLEIRNGKIDYP